MSPELIRRDKSPSMGDTRCAWEIRYGGELYLGCCSIEMYGKGALGRAVRVHSMHILAYMQQAYLMIQPCNYVRFNFKKNELYTTLH